MSELCPRCGEPTLFYGDDLDREGRDIIAQWECSVCGYTATDGQLQRDLAVADEDEWDDYEEERDADP